MSFIPIYGSARKKLQILIIGRFSYYAEALLRESLYAFSALSLAKA
jgi:hypothetical protein